MNKNDYNNHNTSNGRSKKEELLKMTPRPNDSGHDRSELLMVYDDSGESVVIGEPEDIEDDVEASESDYEEPTERQKRDVHKIHRNLGHPLWSTLV